MNKNAIDFELSEELENIPLSIKGEIPDWLSGTLVRNGPVQFRIDDQQVEHWFDGLGMLHAFAFQDGQVKYTNKFLRSDAFHQVLQNRSMNYTGFACDPCKSIFRRLSTFFFPSSQYPIHNANINVAKFADDCVALFETPLPVRFDPQTLATIGVFNYQDDLPKSACFESAHPHEDLLKSEIINYIVDYGLHSKYIIYRIQRGEKARRILAEIPVDAPSYMHSFAVTENYVVLVEFPFVVSSIDFILKNLPFIRNFKWKPDRGTRFIVVQRNTGKVVLNCTAEPFFAFHHANAFEKDDKLVLDIITYPDASVIDELAHHSFMDPSSKTLQKSQETFSISLSRYTISLKSAEINKQMIFNEIHELPRINSAYDGKAYRFLYASDARKPDDIGDVRKIYKINVDTGDSSWWQEQSCYPGEPVFISNPQGHNEDDGIIMTVVINLKDRNSFLLCLDAKDLHEIGRAVVPHQIPQGLHGQWFV